MTARMPQASNAHTAASRGGTEPALIDRCREIIEAGAKSVGRSVSELELAVTPSAYVMDREPAFDELRDAHGPTSLEPAKIYSRMAESIPGIARELVDDTRKVRDGAYRSKGAASEDPRRRHLTTYRGYLTKLQSWQALLITARVLKATSVAGTIEQRAQRVRTLKKHGIARVILSPRPQDVAATIERFGRSVIPRFA